MGFITLLGRICFAAIFIVKSLEHFSKTAIDQASTAGVPAAAFLVPLAGIVAILGGLSILFGYKARLGAILLILFLIPTTFFMHQFWGQTTTFAQSMHSLCFWKNLALFGTCLMLLNFGAGPWSFDHKNICP